MKSLLMELLAHDPDPELKRLIPGLMYRYGLLENEDMDAIVHAPIDNGKLLSPWGRGGDKRYWNDLVDLFFRSRTEMRRERLPLELIPVYGLLHEDADIRSRAIDQIRIMANPGSMAPIENDAVAPLLRKIRPQVKGHAADTIDFALREGRYAALPDSAVKPVPKFEPDSLYRHLMLDTCGDCAGFYGMDPALKAEMPAMREHIESGKPLAEISTLKKVPWGSLEANWPAAAEKADGMWRVWNVKGRDRTDDIGHSMGEVDKYLEGWLGRELTESLRKQEADVLVFAGDVARLRPRLDGFDIKNLKRLPSPYAEWGIEKYFYDRGPGQKPMVMITIPPIEQYAKHYVHLLQEAEARGSMVVLDESSREKHLAAWRHASQSLVGKLETKPDRLVLGYTAQWKEALAKHPDWKIKGSEEVSVAENGMQMTGTVLTIEHKFDPEHPEKILFVTSGKTWWGEAARHLAEGVLDGAPSVKDVWFMGSAGAIGVNSAYPVSVPSSFSLPGQPLTVENSMIPKGVSAGGPVYYDPDRKMPVHLSLGGIHGFSDSPAQQSRDYVTYHYNIQQVKSIDVESPLIAQMIQDRNAGKAEADRVKFGAGYVLTDHPAGFFTYDVGASLAEVGGEHKAKARHRVVDLALDSLANRHMESKSFQENAWKEGVSFFHVPTQGFWIYGKERRPWWLKYRGEDGHYGW